MYLILIYIIAAIEGTFLYIILFRIFNEEATKIPLFGAIILLLLACLFIILQLLWLKKTKLKELITNRDLVLIFVLLFFFNYNLYGLIPFNVSRSNSIIVMGYLKHYSGLSRSERDIKTFVEKKYFEEYDAIQKRLNEQISAGNVIKTEDGYQITQRGIFILNLFSKISSFYNIGNDFTNMNDINTSN